MEGKARELVRMSGLMAAAAALAVVVVLLVAPLAFTQERPRQGGIGVPGVPGGPGGFAGQGAPGVQGAPGGPGAFAPTIRPPGPAAMVASGNYVYVLRGDTLYQFNADKLELVKQVRVGEEQAGARPGGTMLPPGGGFQQERAPRPGAPRPAREEE